MKLTSRFPKPPKPVNASVSPATSSRRLRRLCSVPPLAPYAAERLAHADSAIEAHGVAVPAAVIATAVLTLLVGASYVALGRPLVGFAVVLPLPLCAASVAFLARRRNSWRESSKIFRGESVESVAGRADPIRDPTRPHQRSCRAVARAVCQELSAAPLEVMTAARIAHLAKGPFGQALNTCTAAFSLWILVTQIIAALITDPLSVTQSTTAVIGVSLLRQVSVICVFVLLALTALPPLCRAFSPSLWLFNFAAVLFDLGLALYVSASSIDITSLLAVTSRPDNNATTPGVGSIAGSGYHPLTWIGVGMDYLLTLSGALYVSRLAAVFAVNLALVLFLVLPAQVHRDTARSTFHWRRVASYIFGAIVITAVSVPVAIVLEPLKLSWLMIAQVVLFPTAFNGSLLTLLHAFINKGYAANSPHEPAVFLSDSESQKRARHVVRHLACASIARHQERLENEAVHGQDQWHQEFLHHQIAYNKAVLARCSDDGLLRTSEGVRDASAATPSTEAHGVVEEHQSADDFSIVSVFLVAFSERVTTMYTAPFTFVATGSPIVKVFRTLMNVLRLPRLNPQTKIINGGMFAAMAVYFVGQATSLLFPVVHIVVDVLLAAQSPDSSVSQISIESTAAEGANATATEATLRLSVGVADAASLSTSSPSFTAYSVVASPTVLLQLWAVAVMAVAVVGLVMMAPQAKRCGKVALISEACLSSSVDKYDSVIEAVKAYSMPTEAEAVRVSLTHKAVPMVLAKHVVGPYLPAGALLETVSLAECAALKRAARDLQ